MMSIKLKENDMLAAINQIREHGGSKYNVNLVRSEFQKPIKLTKGTWLQESKIKKKRAICYSFLMFAICFTLVCGCNLLNVRQKVYTNSRLHRKHL